MTYAKNKGVWPRSKPAPPAPGGEGADPSDRPPEESSPSKPAEDPSAERERVSFSAEGLLKEALMRLWKQVRAGSVDQIGVLAIRLFEARDASRLLGAVGSVSGANKTVTFEGGYETRNGGSFELEFRRPVVDAQPVREFIEPKLRDTSARTPQAGFEPVFTDGLAMEGDAAERLTERLSRFASGSPTSRRARKRRSDPMARLKRMALVETPESAPRYELRVRGHRPGDNRSMRSGRCPRS